MQPLGRKPINFPCKIDFHFKKPYVNWWDSIGSEAKKTFRQKSKLEVKALSTEIHK